ncbi:MAG: hypothetical protein RL095_315 [Verrucomicrobiota bacterium]
MRRLTEMPDHKKLLVIKMLFAAGLFFGLASAVLEVYAHAFKQLGLIFMIAAFASLVLHQVLMILGFWVLSRRYASAFVYSLPSFVQRQ